MHDIDLVTGGHSDVEKWIRVHAAKLNCGGFARQRNLHRLAGKSARRTVIDQKSWATRTVDAYRHIGMAVCGSELAGGEGRHHSRQRNLGRLT